MVEVAVFLYISSVLKQPIFIMQKIQMIFLGMLLLIFATTTVNGQSPDFLEGYNGFSKKKTAYVTLADGTEIEGLIKGAKWKKGLMHTIKFVAEKGAPKEPISADKIAFMYVAPSGLETMLNSINNATSVNRHGRDLNADYLKEGYLYFEQLEAIVAKKKRNVLMQLLNPHFAGKISIYNDPFANETNSMSVGPMKVTGGRDKSYYIRKGDGVAIRLKKKNFKKLFDEYFGDCPKIKKEVKRPEWRDLASYVAMYNEACSE